MEEIRWWEAALITAGYFVAGVMIGMTVRLIEELIRVFRCAFGG